MELSDFVFEKLIDHSMTLERVEAFECVRNNDHVVGLSATTGDIGDDES